jgi:hypothetical protein
MGSKKQETNKALIACFAYPSISKMEAVPSSATSVNLYRTPRRHIQEDSTYLEQEDPMKERRHEKIVDPNCIMESQGRHKNEGMELTLGDR